MRSDQRERIVLMKGFCSRKGGIKIALEFYVFEIIHWYIDCFTEVCCLGLYVLRVIDVAHEPSVIKHYLTWMFLLRICQDL